MSKNYLPQNNNGPIKKQKVVFLPEAHEELLKGATILATAVQGTMGPSGHCVIIDNEITAPTITKDGVTVARSINLKDKLQSVGAELLKEIASKTNELAGDGTTTATVLGHSILKEGIKMIATGRSPIGIKRGMDRATSSVIGHLKKLSKPVSNKQDIISIGTISANGDKEIGELLADAISRVGEDGIITIEPSKNFQTTLEVVEGMQFDSGFVSPYFVTNQEKLTCELNNPYVLITNKKISSLQEILPLMEQVANQNRSLLLIADEIEGEALHTLIVNKMKGVVTSCAIKAPSYGDNRLDILQDIAVITNGSVFDASSPVALKNITVKELGTCKKIIVNRNTTTIVGDSSNTKLKDHLAMRVSSIKTALSTPGMLDDLHRNNYKKRLAKLAGGIALVRVGGSTEVEIFEKKDRVEDALNATIAAVQEGILPGGGCALFYASINAQGELSSLPTVSDDEKAGMQVIFNACKAPLQTIVMNTGKSADVIMHYLETYRTEPSKLCEYNRYGYDALNHVYCDLVEKGVIDPLKVGRLALEHASSVIGLLLACNCVIINEDEEKRE